MTFRLLPAVVAVVAFVAAAGCGASRFVRIDAPVLALTHLRVVDGTGRPGQEDQTVLVQAGRISGLGPFAALPIPAGTQVVNLTGRTAVPGLVGMHEHLFYQLEPPSGTVAVATQSTFAKLYLAAGVTTIRTAGTIDFQGDLSLKKRVDVGSEAGPRIHVTGPYLNAVGDMPNPDAIARQVAETATQGATSFKAYTTLRREELRAAIAAAHQRGLPVTGHLCAVGYREAAALGIDNLEHGLIMDTEFYSKKRADECPSQRDVLTEMLGMDVNGPEVQRTIADLVRRGVVVTSTLAVIESYTGSVSSAEPRVLALLSSRVQDIYRAAQETHANPDGESGRAWSRLLRKEMQFERAFVGAGGRLMAGVDPTGCGGVVAGFGDQRELELLVESGFRPEEAIRVATANGAAFLKEADIGTIEVGNRADILVVRGNPVEHMSDVREVDLVLKDGVGYEPSTLIESSQGTIGAFDFSRLNRWPLNAVIAVLALLLVAKILWRMSRDLRPGLPD